jgi:hypothetical protein
LTFDVAYERRAGLKAWLVCLAGQFFNAPPVDDFTQYRPIANGQPDICEIRGKKPD